MFTVVLDVERLVLYSPYFGAMNAYDGPIWLKAIQLPPLISCTEYKKMFKVLSKRLSYDDLICEILVYYEHHPTGPLVQFVLYFLEDKFFPDLARIKLGRVVQRAHHLVSEAINAVGYASTTKWRCSYENSCLTLSEMVN